MRKKDLLIPTQPPLLVRLDGHVEGELFIMSPRVEITDEIREFLDNPAPTFRFTTRR